MVDDEDVLIAVLNSAPRDGGDPAEQLIGARGAALARRCGGNGSEAELRRLRAARDALQAAIRGQADPAPTLQQLLSDVSRRPAVTSVRVSWVVDGPPDALLPVRVIQAWSDVNDRLPGRLKPCANPECNFFLIDRSRPGTAKWCSMAACGNQMKARTYAARRRAARQHGQEER